jgi:hypothetical protein
LSRSRRSKILARRKSSRICLPPCRNRLCHLLLHRSLAENSFRNSQNTLRQQDKTPPSNPMSPGAVPPGWQGKRRGLSSCLRRNSPLIMASENPARSSGNLSAALAHVETKIVGCFNPVALPSEGLPVLSPQQAVCRPGPVHGWPEVDLELSDARLTRPPSTLSTYLIKTSHPLSYLI